MEPRKPTVNRHKPHTVKYRFTCNAPTELSRYNKEYNKEIHDRCVQTVDFKPHVSCIFHTYDGKEGQKCPYSEVQKY